MGDLIADLYRQNEWANLTLLQFCRGLTDRQLDAAAVGSYGSIRQTLAHFLNSETYYVRRLGGDYAGPEIPEGGPWPGFDALEAAVRASAAGFLRRARAAQAAAVAEPAEGEYPPEDEVVLVQALNHSTEHRGQVCTILTALRLEPPDLSAWAWAVADGRIRPDR
jgi:uncharacterized damage-inducible protein DinB